MHPKNSEERGVKGIKECTPHTTRNLVLSNDKTKGLSRLDIISSSYGFWVRNFLCVFTGNEY